MKKKTLCLLLAAAMAFSMLAAGCGSKEPAGNDQSNEASQNESESEKADYSAYEYGEIDYMADVTGIDMSLVEKPMGEIDRETLEYAIQQVCLAYYYKNPATQYDLSRFCYDPNKDAYRRTTGQSPEDSEWDTMWYSQCAEYCYDVYYELCGYEYVNCGTVRTTNEKAKKDLQSTVESKNSMQWDRERVTNFILYESRPGDIFHGNGEEGGGHVIMMVGDIDGDGENDCIHCWPIKGGSFRILETATNGGKQFFDKYGVELQPARELLIQDSSGNGNPNWGVFTKKNNSTWDMMRPFEQLDIGTYHLSTDTVTRMTYPGISLTKTPDCSVHHALSQNGDIVITQEIKNNGKEDFKGLNVIEYVADGTEFMSADNGGTLDGRKIKWTVDVPAGGSTTVSYTLTVKYGAGMTVKFPAGLVAGLQTRKFEMMVGQSKLTDEQKATLSSIASTGKLPEGVDLKKATELTFVTEFYKQVLGKEITLPETFTEFFNALFEERKSIAGCDMNKMIFKKEEFAGAEKLNQLIVLNQIGGLFYSVGKYPGVADYKINRILDIQEGYYEPGDVFLVMNNDSKTGLKSANDLNIYIYLGDGKVYACFGGPQGRMEYSQTMDQAFPSNFVVVIRPTQVY